MRERSCCGSGDGDGVEAQAGEEGCDAGLSVLAGAVKDSVGDGGLGDLFFGCLADLGFEVGVGGDEHAGDAGVDAGVGIVEAGGEDLRCGQVDVDGSAVQGVSVDGDVGGFELAEVDSGDDFAVGDEEELVAGEEVGQQGVLALALDDFVDGVDDGFEAGELADSVDDGGGGCVDGGAAASEKSGEAMENAGGAGDGEVSEASGQEDSEKEAGGEAEDEREAASGLDRT